MSGGRLEIEQRASYDLEGEILWDVAGGFARSASLGGAVERVQTEKGKFETPEGAHEFERVLTFDGEVKFRAGDELKP